MTIEELALVSNQRLEVRFPDVDQNYMFRFANCEIKRGHVLITTCGRGKRLDVARKNYVEEIKGKTIVFDAMSKTDRREVVVPLTLE